MQGDTGTVKERNGRAMNIIEGGVTAAQGFEAAGIEAAIKYQNRKDMAMVYSRTSCRAAGVFTSTVVNR